ncbi:hypothetical protein B0H12DRAFT_1074836 [Mycena haematopus]|nr:hypothetical protein B0H12DRAFT_1074836 [Mycena haematopus]
MSSIDNAASPQLNSDADSIPHIWETRLEPGVTQILRGEQPLGYDSHVALYTAVYNCCTRTKPATLQHCSELYSQVPPFFEAYTAKIFAYLNMHFISRPETGKNVATVLNVALKQWKAQVFEPLASRLGRSLGDAGLTRLDAIRAAFSSENIPPAKLEGLRVRVV